MASVTRAVSPQGGAVRALLTPKTLLLALATALVFAISYYFVVALPAHNAAALQLERLKFEAEQKRQLEKEAADARAREQAEMTAAMKEAAAAQAREGRETLLRLCTEGADETYNRIVKLNGKENPLKPGVYTAPRWVFDDAAKRKQAELDQCYRLYRQ